MIVGSVSENKNIENRVAITPDIVKKYKSIGLDVLIVKDYASHLGIKDKDYENEGAVISKEEEIFANSNLIIQMNILSDENLNKLQKINFLLVF